MAITSQSLLPRWSIPDQVLEPGSRDALGFQRYSSYFANRLLPNITVLTTRARYYGFVAWVIDEINTAREQGVAEGENLESSEFDAWVSRFERWLALGEAITHGKNGQGDEPVRSSCSWIGMRKSRALVSHGRERLPLDLPLTIREGSSLANYRESMLRIGLLVEQPGFLPETLTQQGKELADTYRRSIQINRAGRIRDICLDPAIREVKKDDVGKEASVTCLSNIANSEQVQLGPLLLREAHAPLVAELTKSLKSKLKRDAPRDSERVVLRHYLQLSSGVGVAFELQQAALYQALALGCLTIFNGMLALLPAVDQPMVIDELVAQQIRSEHQKGATPLRSIDVPRLDGLTPDQVCEDECQWDEDGNPLVWLVPAIRLLRWVVARTKDEPVLVIQGVDSVHLESIAEIVGLDSRRLDDAAVRLCDRLARDHQHVFLSKLKLPWLAPDGNTLRRQEMRLEPRVWFPPTSIRLQAFISLWRDLEYAS